MGVFDWIRRPPARHFGFVKGLPDRRDLGPDKLALSVAPPAGTMSLRHPAVLARSQAPNQSCLAFMVAQGVELAFAYKGVMTGDLSARALYFWARAHQGVLPRDDGTTARDVMAPATKFGIPTEQTCTTVPRLVNTAPSWRAHQEARDLGRGLRLYARLDPLDLDTLRRTIAAGVPVGGGWGCDQEFVDYRGGDPIGAPRGTVLGNHAMLITGYYADGTWDLFNQSWLDWGDPGSYARVTGGFICDALELWALSVR